MVEGAAGKWVEMQKRVTVATMVELSNCKSGLEQLGLSVLGSSSEVESVVES